MSRVKGQLKLTVEIELVQVRIEQTPAGEIRTAILRVLSSEGNNQQQRLSEHDVLQASMTIDVDLPSAGVVITH
jgi:hypothetical protein